MWILVIADCALAYPSSTYDYVVEGLAIAKAIVQKHGGEIKAYSPDGERMVFRLDI